MNGTQDDETTHLVSPATNSDKIRHVGTGKRFNRWNATVASICMVSLSLVVVVVVMITNPGDDERDRTLLKTRDGPIYRCRFCEQSPPTVHHDRSYTIGSVGAGTGPDGGGSDGDIVVTPVTITYNYELYDGQHVFTHEETELIPNLDFDYAILGLTTVRNVRRDTGESVSLDEVYVHHLNIAPLTMIGAEIFTRNSTVPNMRFPDGYALHVRVDEMPYIETNAHLLSNKGLSPIDGSLARAHKECNECYYAPGKGSDCTPELSGTFACCGDSFACEVAGEQCACPTDGDGDTSRTTKYQLQIDLLISRDIDRFTRVEKWQFAAPACAVNLNGRAVFKEYPTDNYCSNDSDGRFDGGGSLFHQIAEDDLNPYVRTRINVVAPAGGTIVFAQGHFHTGGINATLLLDGTVICSAGAVYGTDPDPATNARDERNHLVLIEPCYSEIGEAGVRFEAGDVLTTETVYYGGTDDERLVGVGVAGEHKNVMSMFFLGVVFDGDADYLTERRTSFSYWNNFVRFANL